MGAPGDLEMKDVTKTKREVDGQTQYVLKITICNKTDRRVQIKVADNPWKKDPAGEKPLGDKVVPRVLNEEGKPDPAATRRRALDRWKNPDTGDNSPFELAPEGEDGDCHTFEWVYDFEPAALYHDAFTMQPNGEPQDTFSAHSTMLWNDIRTAKYEPYGPKPQYAFVFPLPYPMSLESVYDGDIKVTIDSIEGIPASHELVHVFPPIGVPHHLDFADRQSVGVFFLRPVAADAGRYPVRISYHVEQPSHLKDWMRTVDVDLVVEGEPQESRPRGRKR